MNGDFSNPLWQMRGTVHALLTAHPQLPGGGQVLAIDTAYVPRYPLEVMAQHSDGVIRTWGVAVKEIEKEGI